MRMKMKMPVTQKPTAHHPWPFLLTSEVRRGVAMERGVMINTNSITPGMVKVLPNTNDCQSVCHYVIRLLPILHFSISSWPQQSKYWVYRALLTLIQELIWYPEWFWTYWTLGSIWRTSHFSPSQFHWGAPILTTIDFLSTFFLPQWIYIIWSPTNCIFIFPFQ